MGDRANIVVKSRDEQVCLYTHWRGFEIADIVKEALEKGRARWDDFQYLTRIIFCVMVRGRETELTGFGITQRVHDGADYVITIDVDNHTVCTNGGSLVSFEKVTQ